MTWRVMCGNGQALLLMTPEFSVAVAGTTMTTTVRYLLGVVLSHNTQATAGDFVCVVDFTFVEQIEDSS